MPPVPSAPPRPETQPPIAIVAVGARVADGVGAADLGRTLMRGTPRSGRRSTIDVALDGLRFPPLDLHDTHAQQLLVLEAAREAAAMTVLPRERTMVLVGMGCDPEAARHIARWRVPEWLLGPGEAEADRGRTERLRDAVRPAQTAAAVIGAMPNVVANRINSQLDLAGASFTVSAEEASGVAALETGARALRAGDADAVLVGAVDLSCEPVHRAALSELGRDTEPGDAAVVLVLKRLADARAAGDTVLAVLEGDGAGPVGLTVGDPLPDADGADAPDDRFDPCALYGRAHAASGLLSVAVTALALRHRARPRSGAAAPALDDVQGAAACVPLAGAPTTIRLRAGDVAPFVDEPLPRLHVYSGRDRAEVLSALAAGRESDEGPARLVLCAADAAEHADLTERSRRWLLGQGVRPADAAFQERPVEGEIAFVYSGGSMAHRGMGREAMLAFPAQLDAVRERSGDLRAVVGWAFASEDAGPPHPLDQIGGASVLGQLHTRITQDVLGLRPQAALGYSSGESVALAALGAWRDVSPLLTEARGSQLFTRLVAGDLEAPRRAWRRLGLESRTWASHVAEASPERVRAALAGEPAVHLMVVNAPDSCVFGGAQEACERVLKRLSGVPTLAIGYQIAAHVPEVEEVRQEWRDLHHLPTHPVPGVRFYTCSSGEWYSPTADTAADAVTAQGLGSIDFARTVQQAWDDGVRIFVEHGPRNQCSGWIGRTLGSREHLAVAMDAPEGRGIRRLFHVAAELTAAGVRVDADALYDCLAAGGRLEATPARRQLTLPAHPPEIRLPLPAPFTEAQTPEPGLPLPTEVTAPAPGPSLSAEVMAPAAGLPLRTEATAPAPGPSLSAEVMAPAPGWSLPTEVTAPAAGWSASAEAAPAPGLPLSAEVMAPAPGLALPGRAEAVAPLPPACGSHGGAEAAPQHVVPVSTQAVPPAAVASLPPTVGTVTGQRTGVAGPDLTAVVATHVASVARAHRQFLATQTWIHTTYLASLQQAADLATRAGASSPTAPRLSAPPASVVPTAGMAPTP
ncbi:beta-ketoacyl synthase N-terminal-like domain-containing protein, partial [Streptomyces sp. NPDC002491]